MNRDLRRIHLIQPKLQTKLVGAFVGLATLAMLLQFLYLGMRLIPHARALPGGAELASSLPAIILEVLGFSLLVLLPAIFALGIRMTLKIAGPIYRFERFLEDVAAGERVECCELRRGDELQGLCVLINSATEEQRAQNARRSRPAA